MISNRTIAIFALLGLLVFLGGLAEAESRGVVPSHPAALSPPAATIQDAADPKPMYAGTRIEHDWIPMKDGTRLAVNLFLPANARPGDKFPVILESLPY